MRSKRSGATSWPRASDRLRAKSPYFGSPAIAWPASARWTRIWCVRPVLIVTSSRLKPAKRRATRTRLIERRPRSSSASTVRTWRLAVGRRVLAQGDVDHLQRLRPGADDERRVGLADRPLGRARAQVVLQRDQRRPRLGDEQQARGLLVEAVHELEELASAGRAASARSRRSSRRCRRARRRRPACRSQTGARPRGRRRTRAPGASGRSLRSATRIGGIRTSSPSARRVSAAARPLLTRTSPERMTR